MHCALCGVENDSLEQPIKDHLERHLTGLLTIIEIPSSFKCNPLSSSRFFAMLSLRIITQPFWLVYLLTSLLTVLIFSSGISSALVISDSIISASG